MTSMSREAVVEITGALDDLRIAEIIGTGATSPELLEAKRWVAGYKRTLGDDQPLRPSVVGLVCDILRAEEIDWEEP